MTSNDASLDSLRADASPTKAFFVRMLTRDISLDDCILDLVDNSIDSAWRQAGARPTAFSRGALLEEFEIDIKFDEEAFSITDNCGGISIKNATNYAFTFGRKSVDVDQLPSSADLSNAALPGTDYSVGIYGIGMKRAIFKIGNQIEIQSTHRNDENVEAFQVPINVSGWLADTSTPWDFPIDKAGELDQPGVRIHVTELNLEAKRRFSDVVYHRTLVHEVLSRDYILALMQGLRITVNGEAVPYRQIDLLSGEDFQPLRERFDDGAVSVEIIAGMHALPPEDNDPESSRQDKVSGWYIICNGRVVLAADRSDATGWGIKDFPRWHGQYGGFIGMALFSSADPSLLPMTTTKRSVDTSLPAYQRTVNRMLKPTRAWIDYTNARKPNLLKAREREIAASPVEVSQLAPNRVVVLPKLQTTRAKVANVNYAVPLSRMRALAAALGDVNLTYREVGVASFDYMFFDHVDDES